MSFAPKSDPIDMGQAIRDFFFQVINEEPAPTIAQALASVTAASLISVMALADAFGFDADEMMDECLKFVRETRNRMRSESGAEN